MKILIYTDNHWSNYSSIVRKRGDYYSLRLENQLHSINWAENLAMETGCNQVIHLGDFFDKSALSGEELSALKHIHWAECLHIFLVGNHEMLTSDLRYNSASLFSICSHAVIETPVYLGTFEGTALYALPYILECDRKPLSEYMVEMDRKVNGNPSKKIIFSHNDIQGIQYGAYTSTQGFSIDEIEANCDLFLNGHLHNGEKITSKIINVGSLTGQNFSEDAEKYDHIAIILDTDTLHMDVYENPYAFNFYKLNVTPDNDLSYLKRNAVITAKVKERDATAVREIIANTPQIIESRLIVEPEIVIAEEDAQQIMSVDHMQQFRDYIIEKLGSTEVVLSELQEVARC